MVISSQILPPVKFGPNGYEGSQVSKNVASGRPCGINFKRYFLNWVWDSSLGKWSGHQTPDTLRIWSLDYHWELVFVMRYGSEFLEVWQPEHLLALGSQFGSGRAIDCSRIQFGIISASGAGENFGSISFFLMLDTQDYDHSSSIQEMPNWRQTGSQRGIPCGNRFSRLHAPKNKNKQEGGWRKRKRKERGFRLQSSSAAPFPLSSEVRHPLGPLSIDLFALKVWKIISSRIRREERKSMKTFTSTCSPWHDTTSDETIKIESLQVKGGEGKTWRAFSASTRLHRPVVR